MKFKSVNRFYIFGVALMAMLYLFGIRPNQHSHFKYIESKIVATMNAVHSSEPVHQPIEAEDKEEQTETEKETEDNESNGTGISTDLFDSSSFGIAPQITGSEYELVISGSQAKYHTPVYVRLRSIII